MHKRAVILASTFAVGLVAAGALTVLGRSRAADVGCGASRPPDDLPALAAGPAPAHWSREDLGAGSGDTYASALNDRGQVAGFGSTGLRWEAGKSPIRLTGVSRPTAMTSTGEVVGWSDTEDGVRPYAWEAEGRTRALGTLGGAYAEPVDVNECGEVVGWSDVRSSDTSSWDDPPRHGFLWDGERLVDLGTLGGTNSDARAINDRGEVVGVALTTSGRGHAFLWREGEMQDLGTLGGPSSYAVAINDRGEVVGIADTARRGPDGRALQRPFLWRGGRMTDLGRSLRDRYFEVVAINERSQVLGYSWNEVDVDPESGEIDAVRVFLWENGVLRNVGMADDLNPPVLNDRGQVAGSTESMRPFLWQNGTRFVLPGSGLAAAINNAGQIAGSYYGTSTGSTAAIWTPIAR